MTAPQPDSSLKSVALVTGLSFVQLLIQFVTQLVLAKFFGAGQEMDAFVAALAPPTVIATILSGSLGYVLVPVFSEQLTKSGRSEALLVVSQIGVFLVVASILIASCMAGLAEPLVNLLFPGFAAGDRELTTHLLRLLSILVISNSLIAFLNAAHHCQGRFALPALAGVVGTLVTLLWILWFHQTHRIHAVSVGIVAGSIWTAGLMLPRFLYDAKEGLRPQNAFALNAASRRVAALLAPLVLGSLLWRLDPILDRYLGSYLAPGSISHLGYAWRLTTALLMIGTSGLSIVAFPAIAAHAAAGKSEALKLEVAHALRFLLVLLIPVCAGLACFAIPVVRLLFERGKFTPADTQAVALLLVLYLGLVLGGSLGDLLSRTMYALQDTRTPVIVSTICFVLAAGLKVLLVFVAGYGAAGLAGATSIYHLLSAVVLAVILVGRLGADSWTGLIGGLLRTTVSSAVACGAAYAVGRAFSPFAVLPAAASGLLVYLVVMGLLGDEFVMRMVQSARGQR